MEVLLELGLVPKVASVMGLELVMGLVLKMVLVLTTPDAPP